MHWNWRIISTMRGVEHKSCVLVCVVQVTRAFAWFDEVSNTTAILDYRYMQITMDIAALLRTIESKAQSTEAYVW
jgi:hypothetical protein